MRIAITLSTLAMAISLFGLRFLWANTCQRTDSLGQWSSYPPITVTVSVASDAPPAVVNLVSASGGGSLSAGAGDPTTTAAPSPCDVDIVGSTSVSDVQHMVNEALGVFAPAHDLTIDGIVSVADVQVVINSALGLHCVTAP